jgi:cell division septum initiation protein DivIVA
MHSDIAAGQMFPSSASVSAYGQLDPENTERFDKLALRTKDALKNKVTREYDQAVAYYRANPDQLRSLIKDNYDELSDNSIAAIVNKLSEGDMSLMKIAEMIRSKGNYNPYHFKTSSVINTLLAHAGQK